MWEGEYIFMVLQEYIIITPLLRRLHLMLEDDVDTFTPLKQPLSLIKHALMSFGMWGLTIYSF